MTPKFRAFYKPLKVMLDADKIESINFETKTLGVYMPIENKNFHKLRLSDFELMQYTGLKDKNGKEIYEGDIVRVKIMGGYSDHFCDKEHIKQVAYSDASACWTPFNSCRMWVDPGTTDLREVEVIGNIYSNPKLLEVTP